MTCTSFLLRQHKTRETHEFKQTPRKEHIKKTSTAHAGHRNSRADPPYDRHLDLEKNPVAQSDGKPSPISSSPFELTENPPLDQQPTREFQSQSLQSQFFSFQEAPDLEQAIKKTVKGFPRPLLNLSADSFAAVVDKAFGHALKSPFDPYANEINFLHASYLVPYVGLTGYVGANPKLHGPVSKRLVAGLLGVESGQDAVIRALLYERAHLKVEPYGKTVAEFTNQFSELRDILGHDGHKDEGLVLLRHQGAEGKVEGNVLVGDKYSVAHDRTPEEILRIVHGSGDASVPGGFYPEGGNGHIAKSHLHRV